MESKLDDETFVGCKGSLITLGLDGIVPKVASPSTSPRGISSLPSECLLFLGGGPDADCISPRMLERTSLFFSDT